MRRLETLGVIGAGQMGAGIAQVAAAKGVRTVLFDAQSGAVDKARKDIERRLDRAIEKGLASAADKAKTLEHLVVGQTLADCKDTDMVIEAIVESSPVKEKLFRELDEICATKTLFATNTSSISITRLAAVTKRPEQFIGMHFMNPVPVMQLVEVIRGLQTSDATYESVRAFGESLDKVVVTARHDYPGFLVNRILIPMLNEACFVLMEGIASVEEIDTAMKLGTNQPMGPLTLADFVGLDTCLAICRIFHEELGDDKYRPCPLLVKYVEAGWLGKKSGRGFYRYT